MGNESMVHCDDSILKDVYVRANVRKNMIRNGSYFLVWCLIYATAYILLVCLPLKLVE
jgi:hypothetical protein